MQSAEVVIIGAGVIGASVAYHLAARGCRNVLVVERSARAGEGSTGRATGGFRAQFSTAINVKLSLVSREKLIRFRDEFGVDSGYRPYGYLFVAGNEHEVSVLTSARQMQIENGLREVQPVSADEIARLNPVISTENVSGGTFCQTDGFIRPLEILRGYLTGAARLGVKFQYDTAVIGFRVDGKARVTGLTTTRGEIATGSVVNAAGAWSAEIGKLAGMEIPVLPMKRQVAVVAETGILPDEMPMTIFVGDGFHFRVRDGRVLLLWPDEPQVSDPYDTSVSDAWVSEVTRKARARVPGLSPFTIDRASCWAGLYEMSPDRHAILGASPTIEKFYLANGSSGHGVMHAPALGHLLAEIILNGRATTLDASALRPSRFAEGRPNPGSSLL